MKKVKTDMDGNAIPPRKRVRKPKAVQLSLFPVQVPRETPKP